MQAKHSAGPDVSLESYQISEVLILNFSFVINPLNASVALI